MDAWQHILWQTPDVYARVYGLVRALKLPDYHLEKRDGQYELTFQGSWPEVMLWEIPALAVLMELRGRAVLRDMRRFEIQILYARAMAKLWEKN